MHLSSCLFPKIVYNRFTGEKMMVPCGKCDACKNLRSYMWSQKLIEESKLWKYMIFCTLTYDDNNVPLLFKTGANTLSSMYRERVHKIAGNRSHSFSIDDRIEIKIPDPKNDDESRYYRSRKFFPYVRFKDIQLFIKRLRSKIDYYGKSEENQNNRIVYFFCSEYGPKTLRAHYHGIFFTNSDWVAENFNQLLTESWLFGNRDYSFARSTERSASYVAKYVNKFADLPKLYEDSQICSFYTFSRSLSFGACSLSDSEIFEIFHSSSSTCRHYDVTNAKFVDVPLYRQVENRIFPLLRGFNNLSHASRVELYGIWRSFCFPTFRKFREVTESYVYHRPSLLDRSYDDSRGWQLNFSKDTEDYLKRCLSLDMYNRNQGKDDNNNLKSLYYMSRKIVRFCINYNISLDYYVRRIEEYVKNKNALRLKNQLAFEESYSKQYPLSDLVWLFPSVVDELNNGLCVSVTAFDYYFHHELFDFKPIQQTFDWKLSSKNNADMYNRSQRTALVRDSFDYMRFKSTISHFEII